jgi:hypothetical protein
MNGITSSHICTITGPTAGCYSLSVALRPYVGRLQSYRLGDDPLALWPRPVESGRQGSGGRISVMRGQAAEAPAGLTELGDYIGAMPILGRRFFCAQAFIHVGKISA